MPSRRSVLIGLGGLVAGGGALIGTGAFTTVEAQRTVNVSTTGDGSAFLGLAAARDNGGFVDDSGDTVIIDLDGGDAADNADGTGINQRAETTFRNLVTVTNNGTQSITSLSLTMDVSDDDDDVVEADTFEFTVSPSDGNGNQDTVSNGSNILTGNNVSSSLSSGSSINFGMIIDLIDGGDSQNLPSSATYTLTVRAETANSTATPSS
jgi:hypothetical protein